MSGVTSRLLTRLAATLRQEVAAIKRLDGALIECDIAARRREASLGRRWAAMRTRIRDELEKRQISESDWCKQQLACDVATMRRRVQLAKGWQQYERVRREMGDNGQYGLLYALSLIRTAPHDNATNAHPLRTRSTQGPILEGCHQSRCQFITGDALSELRKMRTGSVNVIVCSPPYWPLKRWYGGSGIGFEPSLKAYLRVLVSVFHEARRVLKDNGVMWIVIGDSYSKSGRKWRPPQSELGDDAGYQGTGRPEGNLLLIPARLAMALQDDGWILRQDIIWDKGWVRPETARDRVTRTHEFALMFAKTRHYFYDTDPLRVPLVSRRTATRGRDKAGLMRWEANGALRNTGNPMGRNSDSVWRVNTGNYKGSHPATFPPELVRRMIVSSCDDDSVVLDIFGGAGTTAMVALQLGHRAVTIDINPSYTNEARLRIEADAMTDGQPSVRADTGVRPVQTNIIDLTVALKQGRERKKPKKIVPIRRRAAASQAAKPGRKRA